MSDSSFGNDPTPNTDFVSSVTDSSTNTDSADRPADVSGLVPDASTQADAIPDTAGDSPSDLAGPAPLDAPPDLVPDLAIVADTNTLQDAKLDGRYDTPLGPDVLPDSAPATCVIAGSSYASGAANPSNACQLCRPSTSTVSWTAQAVGTQCGSVPQTCSGTTKTLAQTLTCTASAQCGLPSTVNCPYGCTANDCTAAVCGDGVTQSPAEQCDGGLSPNQSCAYGLVSCTVCSTSCTSMAGKTSYCGDGFVDLAHEQCDNGATNSYLQSCSPGCKNCAHLAGWDVFRPDDSNEDTGLYFVATQNVTLYQFKLSHQGGPYRVELRQVASPLANSILVASTPTSGWTTPISSPDPGVETINVTWSLVAGNTYTLTDAHANNATYVTQADIGSPLFPANLTAVGIQITGSWHAPNTGDNGWLDGALDQNTWYSITGLQFCLR